MTPSAPAVAIRWLRPADAAAFQTLRLAALQEAPSAFGMSWEEEKDEALSALQQRLAPDPDRGILGAWVGDQLVGTLGIRRQPTLKQRHKMVVWGVYVAPGQRGRSISSALLTEAVAFARQQPGVRQIHLGVTTTNTAALRLYQSAGFTIYGTEPGALMVDGVLYDEHFMVLQLAGI